MKELDLKEIRGQLDGIDSQLVRLFEERMTLHWRVARKSV